MKTRFKYLMVAIAGLSMQIPAALAQTTGDTSSQSAQDTSNSASDTMNSANQQAQDSMKSTQDSMKSHGDVASTSGPCKSDISRFCPDATSSSKIKDCLKSNSSQLSSSCKKELRVASNDMGTTSSTTSSTTTEQQPTS